MEVIAVEEKLRGAGLSHPSLNALKADDTQYTVLLLQPEGLVRVANDAIGHADRGDATRKFSRFFELVNGLGVQPDLVVCPEYSVPWDVLLTALKAGVAPAVGKLWVLGCESLPIGGLADVRERLGDVAMVLDDDVSTVERSTQQYRNPLAYVFRAPALNGAAESLVVLVQYKTDISGDPDNTEARGMLPGKFVYLFGRQPHEVRLMTLICSDVFRFDKAIINQYYDGLLLLHVQLNNGPRHLLYKRYRSELFEAAGKTEVICLNWADHVHSVDDKGQNDKDWKNISGSAWYLLPQEFDFSDARIHENHQHGVYYTRHEPIRVHALQFHYRPRAFLLEATKVFHHAVAKPRSTRTGPRAINNFFWSTQDCVWRAPRTPQERPDDGFELKLNAVALGGAANLADMRTLYESGPVLVERVAAIAAGRFGPKANWHEPPRIDSMQLCEAEIVRRVTVMLDTAPEADAFRNGRFANVRHIAELRLSAYAWPTPVEALRSGFRFTWDRRYPNRNVVADDGTLATIVHAGMAADLSQLEALEAQVRKTIAGPPPDPDRVLTREQEKEFEKRHVATAKQYCILYSTAGGTKYFVSANEKSIASPGGQTPVHIAVPSLAAFLERKQKGA
ncbi:hypothetical protein [Roseateles sp. P5_D6]